MSDILNVRPDGVDLSDIALPNQWVLYIYDKQLFKKMTNHPEFKAKPHKEICKIKTLNDILFIFQLMEVEINPKTTESCKKINLDMNNYIIMRDGIEPIWEDPKNSNGGTFSVKLPYSKGYDIWTKFIAYMVGETLTHDMPQINGITVSCISDSNYNQPLNNSPSNNFTYIKVWDGKSDRTRDQFMSILPFEIHEAIKNESITYSANNKKKDFGERNIVDKLNHNKYNNTREKGSFKSNRYAY
jgi:hypothetical protein